MNDNVKVLYCSETRKLLVPVAIDMECSLCDNGFYICLNVGTPQEYLNDPEAVYEHECDGCGNRIYLKGVYPRIEYDDWKNRFSPEYH